MIHAYHVIFGAYGFWMPNDPRGSWSDFVWKWELLRFGRASKGIDRHDISADSQALAFLHAQKQVLRYPPVQFGESAAQAIGRGFAHACHKNGYGIHGCSILPEHIHLVVAHHRYKVEQVVNLLEARQHGSLGRKTYIRWLRTHNGERPPTCWCESCWKVYLDNEEAIDNAIRYVEENPDKEGQPRQSWPFVIPFRGIERNIVAYP